MISSGFGAEIKISKKTTGIADNSMSDITQSKSRSSSDTIDWESFFENKETGLIVLVSKAKSITSLRKYTDLVVEMLRMSEQDVSLKKRLKPRFDSLFSNGSAEKSTNADEIKKSVIGLLGKIKAERINKLQTPAAMNAAAEQEKVAVEKSEQSIGVSDSDADLDLPPELADHQEGDDPVFQSFEAAFMYFLAKFIRVKLACFIISDLDAPKPFILTKQFVDIFVDKSIEIIAPQILKNRRLQTIAQGFSDADLVEKKFYQEFEKPEKQNTTHLLWRSGVLDLQQGLSIPSEKAAAAAAAKAKGDGGGLFGKLKNIGKKAPAPAPNAKPNQQQEKRRKARDFWSALQNDAKSHGYDAPLESDFGLFVAAFEYEEEVITQQLRIAGQMLDQETKKGGEGRTGATRDFLTRAIDELPPFCGELVGLWAFRKYPAKFGPDIIRSFLSGMATTDEKRNRMLPLFTRWVPDLSELPEETKK